MQDPPENTTAPARIPDAAKRNPLQPTPENTPVPGGGSYTWDTTLPGWVRSADSTQHPSE